MAFDRFFCKIGIKNVCGVCIGIIKQLNYGVEGYSKFLVPRDQVHFPRLGGPETCYIPQPHTLTVYNHTLLPSLKCLASNEFGRQQTFNFKARASPQEFPHR